MAVYFKGGTGGFFHLTNLNGNETNSTADETTLLNSKGGHIDIDSYTSPLLFDSVSGYYYSDIPAEVKSRLLLEEAYLITVEFKDNLGNRHSMGLNGPYNYSPRGYKSGLSGAECYMWYASSVADIETREINNNKSYITTTAVDITDANIRNLIASDAYMHFSMMNLKYDSVSSSFIRRAGSFVNISTNDFFIGNNGTNNEFRCNGVDMSRKSFLYSIDNTCNLMNSLDLTAAGVIATEESGGYPTRTGAIGGYPWLYDHNGTLITSGHYGVQLGATWFRGAAGSTNALYGLSSNAITAEFGGVTKNIIYGHPEFISKANTANPELSTISLPPFTVSGGTTTIKDWFRPLTNYTVHPKSNVGDASAGTCILLLAFNAADTNNRIDYTITLPLVAGAKKQYVNANTSLFKDLIEVSYDVTNGYMFKATCVSTDYVFSSNHVAVDISMMFVGTKFQAI